MSRDRVTQEARPVGVLPDCSIRESRSDCYIVKYGYKDTFVLGYFNAIKYIRCGYLSGSHVHKIKLGLKTRKRIKMGKFKPGPYISLVQSATTMLLCC